MVRIADLKYDSWLQIAITLKRGKHPSRAHLISALRRGEPVPPEAQAYIAGLLDGTVVARGRPSTWAGPYPYTGLMSEVDSQRVRFEIAGERSPMRKAFEVVAARHHISPETAEKYYRKGCTQIRRAARQMTGKGTKMDPFVCPTNDEST